MNLIQRILSMALLLILLALFVKVYNNLELLITPKKPQAEAIVAYLERE